ncbi:MAG: Hpt domain-containing protein [Leptospirales bacterium]|nr:Hpt domain-containing protein [Leptospirales bacterium]
MSKFDAGNISFLSIQSQLRVASTFLDQLTEYERRLNEEHGLADRKATAILAHSLRGSSLAFGIPELAAACEALEEAAALPDSDLSAHALKVRELAGRSAESLRPFVESLKQQIAQENGS